MKKAKQYEAPSVEFTEVMVEQGIAISPAGINGPTYTEEDVLWLMEE